ncbi:hypothetical protein AB6A40_000727 [Gnathostoma spinigerum]|uniref:RING-type domain-containing protein n=1 Tax=Gnathostoma spinigerum TaxID=75299 RepID=A0ABD6E2M2_9BILA
MDSEANEMNSSMCNEQRKDPSTKRLNTTEDYACFPGPSSARFTNEADIVKADNSMSLDNSKECKMESRDPCCICLGPLSDETHLSCCPHLFCYLCLTEWIKMKPCCPMCKRPIKTIRHHFKPLSDSSSGENFEEFVYLFCILFLSMMLT